MATDYLDLIPHAMAQEIVGAVTDQQSALMQLAQTIQMPSGVTSVPVVTAAPVAGFVNPSYGGLKPAGSVDWEAAVLTAGEIGCVVAIPQAYVDDAGYPVWQSVRSEIAKAFTSVFEHAALYGTNAPADWPAEGLTAPANATPAPAGDALGAIDAALARLEKDGITPDGILGGSALRSALRSQMVTTLQPFSAAPAALYGVPVAFSANWDDSVGLALVGGFQDVLVGVRQDIAFDTSTDAVITDATGKVVLNAFQQDSIAMRAYLRIALQEVHPIGEGGAPVVPLALATVGAAARSK